MTQLSPEVDRRLDQLARAVKVARKPRRICEVRRGGHSRVMRKLFSDLAVALLVISVDCRLELASRLGQVPEVYAGQPKQTVGDACLADPSLRFRLSKKSPGDVPARADF